jgi:hypothetical protein
MSKIQPKRGDTMTIENLNIQLRNNPLEYRSKLTIPERINFGLELELDQVNRDEVFKLVRKEFGTSWIVKEDKSLTKGQNAEIVSPVLQNKKHTWQLLQKMGQLLERLNPNYSRCSFQVNFDGSLLPSIEDKIRFLKLYAMYEDIIYRFSKGEDSEYRETLDMYAPPIILALKGALQYDDEYAIDLFSDNKRYGLVFKSKQDLIEFRTPNMTSNPTLMQNYITAFYYLLRFATSNKYNKKEVDKYIENFYKIYLLEGYELLKTEKALKLSNMIFTHKQDQLYFMHQYLGK